MSEDEPETLEEEIRKRFCVKIERDGKTWYRLDCTKLDSELIKFIKELVDL